MLTSLASKKFKLDKHFFSIIQQVASVCYSSNRLYILDNEVMRKVISVGSSCIREYPFCLACWFIFFYDQQ